MICKCRMKEEMFQYSFANRLFYETLTYASWNKSEEWMNTVSKYIEGKNYRILEDDFYLKFICEDNNIPVQGWKIHVSASLANIVDILNITSQYFTENGISFKVIKSKQLYALTSQKFYPREMYGKFITAYPKDVKVFKKTIKDLYKLLHDFEGPRVLSDRRYKEDCSVLYYRYGGMMPYCKYDTLGRPCYYIQDNTGKNVEDVRTPYYETPYFVKDPFRMGKLPKSKLLQQYQIRNVIDYKNSGGIYLAENEGKKYVIKEARPYTLLVSEKIDAIKVRTREAQLLRELEREKCVPKLKDAFTDTEHFFIIEEYCEGETLYEYIMFHNSYLRKGSVEEIEQYIKNLICIFQNIAAFLARMESKGIAISDLTPDNILVRENNEIKIVDLEGAAPQGEEIYISKSTNCEKKSIYYDYCKLFFFCMFAKGEILEINQNFMEKFWFDLKEEYSGITDYVYEAFNKIYNMGFDSFYEIEVTLKNLRECNEKLVKNPKKGVDIKHFHEFVELLYQGIINSKNSVNGMTYPCNPFILNEYNMANGSIGIEFSLNKIKQETFDFGQCDYKLWGLYTGAAGVLWSFIEANKYREAEEIAEMLMAGSYQEDDISFYSGMSGIGTALLKLYFYNGNDKILEAVLKIQRRIESILGKNNISGRGIKFGRTGISIFYLYLYLATNKKEIFDQGQEMLMKECEYLVYREDGKIDLPNDENEIKASPYFLEGTAGLLAVLVRYFHIFQDKQLEEWIKKLVDGIDYNQVFSCTLFYGNAGIGNVFLDCYYYLNDERYLEKAMDIAKNCCLYEYRMPDGGALVADLFNMKLSADLGYGASGVMLFLNRLCNNEKYNFCFFIDEIMDKGENDLCTKQY